MSARNVRWDGSPLRAGDPGVDGIAFAGTSDVTLDTHSRAVYIGDDGNLTVDMLGHNGAAGATNVLFKGVKAGSILPIAITKIYDTGTTVSGVALL